jgi:hypothetical protein
MAVTIIGGLALGTLVTLGLVPVLYELLFGGRLARWLARANGTPAASPSTAFPADSSPSATT